MTAVHPSESVDWRAVLVGLLLGILSFWPTLLVELVK